MMLLAIPRRPAGPEAARHLAGLPAEAEPPRQASPSPCPGPMSRACNTCPFAAVCTGRLN